MKDITSSGPRIFRKKDRFDDVKPRLDADIEFEKGDLTAISIALAGYIFPIVIGMYGFFALLTWVIFR